MAERARAEQQSGERVDERAGTRRQRDPAAVAATRTAPLPPMARLDAIALPPLLRAVRRDADASRVQPLVASGMLALQRTRGNQYVQRLLSPVIARAAHKVEEPPEEDVLENERPKRELRPPATVAGAGRLARAALGGVRWLAREGDDTVPKGRAYDAARRAVDFVLKKPGPKRSNSKPSTTSTPTPTFKGDVAVDAAAKAWRFQVDSIKSKGKIQIVYYTKSHYPAPSGDSGALTNVKEDNWETIVDDLERNRAGVFDFWGAYQAEDLHEDYHWDTEWKGAVRPEAEQAQTDIAGLSVPFATTTRARKAKKILVPQAKALFKAAMRRARAAYNALGDSAGDPPYIAQAPAVDAMVERVKAHASEKEW